MKNLRVTKYLALFVFVSFVAAGCGFLTASDSQIGALAGYWHEDEMNHVLHITEDGTYAIDHSGRLESNPLDSGTVKFDGETLTFISGEKSRKCEDGDLWVWEVEIVDNENWNGVITISECASKEIGMEWYWTSCTPERFGKYLLECEPVK